MAVRYNIYKGEINCKCFLAPHVHFSIELTHILETNIIVRLVKYRLDIGLFHLREV